jgi:small-conductance mechanosensitive channel
MSQENHELKKWKSENNLLAFLMIPPAGFILIPNLIMQAIGGVLLVVVFSRLVYIGYIKKGSKELRIENIKQTRLARQNQNQTEKTLKQIKYLLMGIAGSMAIGFLFWALVFGGFFTE